MKSCLIHIVTFNHQRTIAACLDSLRELDCADGWAYSVLVSDNASTDQTVEILRERAALNQIQLIVHPVNLGFSAAHNLALAAACQTSAWQTSACQPATGQSATGQSESTQAGVDAVLILNPDVAMTQSCLKQMLEVLFSDPRVGSVTPKLLRCGEDLQPPEAPIVDAAGMWMSTQLRHFDRGSGESLRASYNTGESRNGSGGAGTSDTGTSSSVTNHGQFDEPGFVFGGTGAALLVKRDFISDVAFQFNSPNSPAEKRSQTQGQGPESSSGANVPLNAEFFDEAFFAYREDADLAWRANLLGWRCYYCPTAVAYHVRRVLPERRHELPPHLNRFSVRNRFLMQLNNFSPREAWHCLIPATMRNLLVVAGVLLSERSSIPALADVVVLRRRQRQRRQFIRRRLRASASDVSQWFTKAPHVLAPLRKEAALPIGSVSIVIVNFNSGVRLQRCVESILPLLQKRRLSTSDAEGGAPIARESHRCEIDLVVLDNASVDSSVDAVEKLLADYNARVVRSPHNLGFAGAVNAGATKTTGDAILILNPDVIVSRESVLAQVEALNCYRSLAAVTPTFVTASGVIQLNYCARRFPSFLATAFELLGLHQLFPRNPWNLTDRYLDDVLLSNFLAGQTPSTGPHHDLTKPYLVEQPSGACLMVRRSAFMQVGGFDEGYYPAWFEDVDFCLKLAAANWSAAVIQHARVVHEGGYSLKVLTRSQFTCFWYRNLFRFWRTHRSILAYVPIRLVAAIGLVARACLALLKREKDCLSFSWACLKSIFTIG